VDRLQRRRLGGGPAGRQRFLSYTDTHIGNGSRIRSFGDASGIYAPEPGPIVLVLARLTLIAMAHYRQRG